MEHLLQSFIISYLTAASGTKCGVNWIRLFNRWFCFQIYSKCSDAFSLNSYFPSATTPWGWALIWVVVCKFYKFSFNLSVERKFPNTRGIHRGQTMTTHEYKRIILWGKSCLNQTSCQKWTQICPIWRRLRTWLKCPWDLNSVPFLGQHMLAHQNY